MNNLENNREQNSNTSPEKGFSRRQFLLTAGAAAATIGLTGCATALNSGGRRMVQTVLGPVPADEFGPALVHEHVICDFIGADKTGPQRWNGKEVVRVMRPYIQQLKDRGFNGFVDCTPAYIGRDPAILRKLSELTRLHIITNTGLYGGAGDKFVPQFAYQESVEQLVARWVGEWQNGIESTGIKPGFMKIGIDEINPESDKLSKIDEKIVRASARTSGKTGLSVTCHTGGGAAGMAAARIFIQEGGEPSRFVVAHSDGHGLETNRRIAEMGAWVSFDGIGNSAVEEHLKYVLPMLTSHADRLLLSHDRGWFNVGETNGGKIRDFNFIPDEFIPALRRSGIAESMIDKIFRENPASVFQLQSSAG